MNESLTAVWTRGKSLIGIRENFIFLCIFSILMIGSGWLSYQNMLKKERRL